MPTDWGGGAGADIGRTLIELGRIRGENSVQQGNIWGHAIANIGSTIENAPLIQMRQQEMQARAAELQGLAQDRQLKAQQMQASQAAQAKIQQLASDPTLRDESGQLDLEKFSRAVAVIDPRLADSVSQMSERLATSGKTRAQLAEEQRKLDDAHRDRIASALGDAQSPEEVQIGLAALHNVVPDSMLQQTAAAFDQYGVEGGRQFVRKQQAMKPPSGKTREVKVTNPDGTETISIVEDKAGQTFTSAAKPASDKNPTETTLAIDAADPNSPTRARSAAALRLLKPTSAGGLTPDASAKRQDAATVAQGIKKFVETGEGLSPEILLSTRTTEQGMALNAELSRLGVDTAKVTREWTATKNAIRSLNGASQIRLAEVINKASSSLDKIDELNKQWSANAQRWGIKVLNRASLKAAQNGAYGPEAQSVAQRLDGEIADVTGELGQGIMGGNSPTDQAFKLASKNLSSDWTQKVLTDSIQQVRYNLNRAQQARNDLLEQVGVRSTQVQTPAPGASLDTAPSAGATPPPGARIRTWNPKTGRLE